MGDPAGLVGQVIADKYAVDRVIGRGAMATVLRATHSELDKPVAIKVLSGEAMEHAETLARFLREARAAARIKSEHVAQVYDVGRVESGAPYIVMEYLEGQDLAAELREFGELSATEATDIVMQALEAVAHAHALGVVHRDIKPANFFVVRRADGSRLIKVLDFGISKAKEDADVSLTGSASMLGSPLYMAPEQIRNAKLADERADIWSLGVLLYECLAGVVPFPGTSPSGVLAAIVADEHIPLLTHRPDVPTELSHVVDRTLLKDPEARIQTVADLASQLAVFAPPEARRIPPKIASILGVLDKTLSSSLIAGSSPPESGGSSPREGGTVGALDRNLNPGESTLAIGSPEVYSGTDRFGTADAVSEMVRAADGDSMVSLTSETPLSSSGTSPSSRTRGSRRLSPVVVPLVAGGFGLLVVLGGWLGSLDDSGPVGHGASVRESGKELSVTLGSRGTSVRSGVSSPASAQDDAPEGPSGADTHQKAVALPSSHIAAGTAEVQAEALLGASAPDPGDTLLEVPGSSGGMGASTGAKASQRPAVLRREPSPPQGQSLGASARPSSAGNTSAEVSRQEAPIDPLAGRH